MDSLMVVKLVDLMASSKVGTTVVKSVVNSVPIMAVYSAYLMVELRVLMKDV